MWLNLLQVFLVVVLFHSCVLLHTHVPPVTDCSVCPSLNFASFPSGGLHSSINGFRLHRPSLALHSSPGVSPGSQGFQARQSCKCHQQHKEADHKGRVPVPSAVGRSEKESIGAHTGAPGSHGTLLGRR